MKKILSLAIIFLLLISTFSIIAPLVKAEIPPGTSEKGILIEEWKYNMQSLFGTIYFGSSPAIANLLGGQDLEIVTGSDEYWNYFPELGYWAAGIWRCFDSKGNLLWARDTETDESRSSPVIADINQDGYLDIVGGTTSGWNVEAMDRFGNFIWTFPWPPKPGAPFLWPSSPAAADIDNSISGLEVIIGNWWLGSVWAFDGDNSDEIDDGITVTDWWIYGGIEGIHWDVLWVFQTDGSVVSSPALGDIDNDGQIEVVIGSMDGKVYILNGKTGALEWSYQTGSGVASSAAIADLDGDPYFEIITGSTDGKVYCLKWDGTTGSVKWTFTTSGSVFSSPAIGDIDGDGKYDVVVGSDDGNIYALNADGSLKWNYLTGGAIHSSPALANRGTKGLGVYIGSYDGYLYLIDGITGTLIDRFLTYGDIYTSPSVADVDGDGKLEIFFYDASWSLYRYTFWALEDTASTVSPYAIEWQMFRRDASRTGLYPIIMRPAVQLATWTTDSDFNNITDFRAVFTPYKKRGYHILTSTNPGQFYFNILVNNTSPLPINMTVKYDLDPNFTLKGARPIHVYVDLNRTINITANCTFSGNIITVYNVAPGSIIYVTIHLEYALKGTMWTKEQVNAWYSEELFKAVIDYTFDVIFGSESSETRIYGHPKIVTEKCYYQPFFL